MSDGVLPQRVNTRKAVAREARYAGVLGPSQLADFAGVLADDDGAPVAARVRFGRDGDDRAVVAVSLRARVRLECQRCLGWFSRELRSDSRLALVAGDEQAKQLPADYEPLLSGEDTDLWSVVAEELALALPVVAYHPRGECVPPPKAPDSDPGAVSAQGGSPFEVLSALLDQPAGDKNDRE